MGKRIKEEEEELVHPLLQMIDNAFEVMNAYIYDSKCEIIMDGQLTIQHNTGPPTYGVIFRTYENMDIYFMSVGAVLPLKLPRFVARYNYLKGLCEAKNRL